jgi:hypothetical protein
MRFKAANIDCLIFVHCYYKFVIFFKAWFEL